MRLSRQAIVFLLMLVFLFCLNVVMTYNLFTSQFPGQNDFLSRWEGARSFWVDGISPYSEQATLNIQMRIFGRPAVAGEDLGLFVYPFYTAILIAPTVILPYPWAAAVIISALETALIVATFLLLRVYRWQVRPWLLACLILWSLFNYYALRGIFLGQLGIIVYLCIVVAIWALDNRLDAVAGVALAIATIKPQMGYLLIPCLLLWALRQRRWRFVASFGMAFGVLMGMSFLLVPSWFGDWLQQVSLYPSYTRDGSPVWIITQSYLQLGNVVEGVVNLLFGVWLAYLWYGVIIRRQHERTFWTIVMTTILANIFSFKTATPHFVVFIIPMIFYFRELSRRKYGVWWVLLLLLATLVLPWVHFVTTIEGRLENLVVFLPAPLILLGVTWATRRLWWARAPFIDVPKISL